MRSFLNAIFSLLLYCSYMFLCSALVDNKERIIIIIIPLGAATVEVVVVIVVVVRAAAVPVATAAAVANVVFDDSGRRAPQLDHLAFRN